MNYGRDLKPQTREEGAPLTAYQIELGFGLPHNTQTL